MSDWRRCCCAFELYWNFIRLIIFENVVCSLMFAQKNFRACSSSALTKQSALSCSSKPFRWAQMKKYLIVVSIDGSWSISLQLKPSYLVSPNCPVGLRNDEMGNGVDIANFFFEWLCIVMLGAEDSVPQGCFTFSSVAYRGCFNIVFCMWECSSVFTNAGLSWE